VSGRHEGGGLFVAGEHELDAGSPQGLHDVEVLLARDAEHMFDALVLESCDKQV
jgi:hypothetical protein